jgi:glycosyltransferase involved in cell wall biosynthesis
VTGFVDDTRDWLRRASLAVAPLRIARGIQNKVLEALAMGLPLVGTTCATQGTEGTPGEHFLVEDTAEGEVEAVVRLLTDRSRAAELARAGRGFVEKHYDWEVVLGVLDEIVAGR